MRNLAISLIAVLIWVCCLSYLVYTLPAAIGLDRVEVALEEVSR